MALIILLLPFLFAIHFFSRIHYLELEIEELKKELEEMRDEANAEYENYY